MMTWIFHSMFTNQENTNQKKEKKNENTNQRLRFTPRFLAPLLSSQSSHFTFTSPSNNIVSFLLHIPTYTPPTKLKTTTKMLLGKRPRHNMKRTTSMSEITFDLNNSTINDDTPHNNIFSQNHVLVSYGGQIDQSFLYNTAPSRPNRRASADFLETPHFLRSCALCKRKLVAGRDIYMYRYHRANPF